MFEKQQETKPDLYF